MRSFAGSWTGPRPKGSSTLVTQIEDLAVYGAGAGVRLGRPKNQLTWREGNMENLDAEYYDISSAAEITQVDPLLLREWVDNGTVKCNRTGYDYPE
jgi:hypothetical protein